MYFNRNTQNSLSARHRAILIFVNNRADGAVVARPDGYTGGHIELLRSADYGGEAAGTGLPQ